jgi:hypothetical protein
MWILKYKKIDDGYSVFFNLHERQNGLKSSTQREKFLLFFDVS